MSFVATVLLVNALTFPIPPNLNPNTPAPIYDSPDLYGDKPSEIALDYSTIRSKLHNLGFRPITEATFAGGRWKIKALYGGKPRALEVDPDSGLIISDRPDRN
ncbi:hypothetical protein [Microbulbifer thermotolerans]|uniref:PepSY domain-containing protein n=1 Tax=Microbulbifer thermotolerans TaxID=252514 RepID=A0A143HNC3_MICTH|nr:hypothetical protein [Microbulbifer thermotolerans]AMX03001.1 hypothetical protein A3224_10850 [Microbulbifer thermotolerans]MCX2779933.1 hypothetical protein [Microbulbifer thermotolerans]MCX2781548.1 hypothetical protein [Microbulbifer thermotolerans]MCX2794706.1 hypothetical protein [Microbulbifer thermotolerans]MCX2802815.1 hypothetical protein [Microbulbifer thermotolerans]